MRTTGTCGVFERVASGELTPEEGARLLMPSRSIWRGVREGIAFVLLMLLPYACAALVFWVVSLVVGAP